MHRIILFYLLFIPLSLHATDKNIKMDACKTSEECVEKISLVMDRHIRPGQYPSSEVEAIIKKLLALRPESMPAILALLDDDDELVARIGAIALAKANSIDEKYLPQIIDGIERDVSWLAPALAKIGTPEAAEIAVKIFLVSKGAPHNQEGYALRVFGKRALPAIMKAAECEFGCNDKTYYLLGNALSEMKNSRSGAAKSLIEIVHDSSISLEIRRGALYMISFLKEPGLIVEDKLLEIRDNEPQLTGAANSALIGIKSKYSGEIYAGILSLDTDTDKYILRDIAELGPAGNGAGYEVAKLLDSNDTELRLFAARTLGFIKYKQAASKLVQLMNEPSDAQLNWVATESLGRMKAESATSDLHIAAESHWYPPVRDAAITAAEYIASGDAYKNKFHENNFAFDYFEFEHMGVEPCESITLKAMSEPEDQKLYKSHAKEQLQNLAYQSVILSYGADDADQQIAGDPNGIIEVNESNIVEVQQDVKQIPHVALKVNKGWLAGSDRGEWGGELIYIPDNGKPIVILSENIEDIYKLGDKYIATTGLAHMSMNKGMIYELLQDSEGYWHKKQWLTLPGSPESSWLVETGEILVSTTGGGSILLSKDGSMRMAVCK